MPVKSRAVRRRARSGGTGSPEPASARWDLEIPPPLPSTFHPVGVRLFRAFVPGLSVMLDTLMSEREGRRSAAENDGAAAATDQAGKRSRVADRYPALGAAMKRGAGGGGDAPTIHDA